MELSSFEGSGMTRVSSDVRGLSRRVSRKRRDWGIKRWFRKTCSPASLCIARMTRADPLPAGAAPKDRVRIAVSRPEASVRVGQRAAGCRPCVSSPRRADDGAAGAKAA